MPRLIARMKNGKKRQNSGREIAASGFRGDSYGENVAWMLSHFVRIRTTHFVAFCAHFVALKTLRVQS